MLTGAFHTVCDAVAPENTPSTTPLPVPVIPSQYVCPFVSASGEVSVAVLDEAGMVALDAR
jgi:hypothetical protein